MKIGFYGATGSFDFGDYAMMIHNLQLISAKIADVQFDIYTPNKYITLKNLYENLLDKTLLKRINIIDGPSLLNDGKSRLKNLLALKLFKSDYVLSSKFHKLANGNIDVLNSEFVDSIKAVDLLLFNGGGFLQQSWGQKNILFFSAIKAAKHFNKPIHFLGCSIGPMGRFEKYLAETIHDVTSILLRDGNNYSAKRIEKYRYGKYEIGPDDLLFVCDFYDQIKPVVDNYIVIEIMSWIGKSKKGIQYVLTELNKFVNYITEKENKNVILISFDDTDSKGIEYINWIYNNADSQDKILRYTKINNIYDVFSIYRYCCYSLSFKYHPIILALGCNKPCSAVICDDDGYYEGKMFGAFDSCGINGCNNIIHLNELTSDILITLYHNNQELTINSMIKDQLLLCRDHFISKVLNLEWKNARGTN